MPVTINVLQGRRKLPPRAFVLPGPLGWIFNLVGMVYVLVTTVLFVFPPDLPVTGSNMNYCVVVFFLWLVIAMVQWFVDGRANFKGPTMDFNHMGGGVLEAQRSDPARAEALELAGGKDGKDA